MTSINIHTWRKSSRSAGSQSNCVEVAEVHDSVAIRDSKAGSGDDFPLLAVPREGWISILTDIKHGHLAG